MRKLIIIENNRSTISKRIAIKVKPAAERSIRSGHPWVFEGSIVKQSSEGQAGDTAIVFDKKNNKLLAVGLYDPTSPIRIKLISFGKSATLDRAWFEQKIKQAFEVRKPLLLTDTNSYRLVHGENDGLPSLIADVYAEVLVLKLYSPIWLPYLEILFPVLLNISKCKTLVLRFSRSLQNTKLPNGWSDGSVVFGELAGEEVIFREHGLRFSANVVKGHKTGFFLDHRNNRKRIGEMAEGKTVLDVFSYAGGFSVHALAGGAREVISLDISRQALEMAEKNVALNSRWGGGDKEGRHKEGNHKEGNHKEGNHKEGNHKEGNHKGLPLQTMKTDAFKGMEQLRRSGKIFDIVVVDPPSFAKKESEVKGALNSYVRLVRLAVPLVKTGGILLMASCSSRVGIDLFFETIEAEMEHSGKKIKLIEKTFHDVDHPIGFTEGAYLKTGYYRVV